MKTSTTTANGKTYEIEIDRNFFNADIADMANGRMYSVDCSDTTDEDATDDENMQWALEDAIDWCEWHSTHETHEVKDGEVWRCL